MKTQKRSNPDKRKKAARVAGFIANLFLPGIWTIILGKYDTGAVQSILMLAGLFFSITSVGVVIGIIVFAGTWIWALITGLKALKRQS